MISRDKRCVFVADYLHEASLVIGLLGEDGIEAQMVNDATLGGLEGVVSIIPRAGIKGIEVWVRDVAQAADARAVLERRGAEVAALRQARAARTGKVSVTCPACRHSALFPASRQGTVETCPGCGKFIDIPDPEDEFEWPADFGSAEDDSPTDA